MGHKWCERRKINIHYERENKENQSSNAIKQTNTMKNAEQKQEKKKTNKIKELKIMKK